jgi:CRISPR-associated protein Cas2
MALNETRSWLIAYDITCPKRLGRVHRYLKKVAVPVQYSIFIAEENDQGINRIRDELAQIINAKTDDLRIYPLPKNLELHQYGRRALPEGLQLLVDRENRHSGLLAGADKKLETGSEK